MLCGLPLCSGLSLPPDAFLHASCRLGFITCNLIKATPILKAFWLPRTESKCLGFGSEMFYRWCCLQALWTSSPSSTACLESIRPPSADATLLLRPLQKPFLHDGSVGTASRTHFPLLPAAHTFPSQWLSSFLERVLIGHGMSQIIIQQRLFKKKKKWKSGLCCFFSHKVLPEYFVLRWGRHTHCASASTLVSRAGSCCSPSEALAPGTHSADGMRDPSGPRCWTSSNPPLWPEINVARLFLLRCNLAILLVWCKSKN